MFESESSCQNAESTDTTWDRTIPHQTQEFKPDVAFYYPGQYWSDVDWIKNLVLFFDGIGMLIPSYMPDQGSWNDFPVVEALKENQLFHVIRPEEHVGAEETQTLATAIQGIIDSGGLDTITQRTERSSAGRILVRCQCPGWAILETVPLHKIFLRFSKNAASP